MKVNHICLRGHSAEGERVFHDGRAKRAERGAFGDVLCDVLAVVGGRGRERFQRLGEVRPLQKTRVNSTVFSCWIHNSVTLSGLVSCLRYFNSLFRRACSSRMNCILARTSICLPVSSSSMALLLAWLYPTKLGADPLTVSKILRLNT